MGHEDAAYVPHPLGEVRDIRDDEVYAHHFRFWKEQAAVNENQVIVVLKYSEIFSDLTNSTERDDA